MSVQNTVNAFDALCEKHPVINSIYESQRWETGQSGEANIIKYNGEDVIGIARIENHQTKEHLIVSHNLALMKALMKAYESV